MFPALITTVLRNISRHICRCVSSEREPPTRKRCCSNGSFPISVSTPSPYLANERFVGTFQSLRSVRKLKLSDLIVKTWRGCVMCISKSHTVRHTSHLVPRVGIELLKTTNVGHFFRIHYSLDTIFIVVNYFFPLTFDSYECQGIFMRWNSNLIY